MDRSSSTPIIHLSKQPLVRPTHMGRARSGMDGVGRAPPRRAATGDMDKDKERDVEMPKMAFVAVQIFHTALPARS